MRNIYLKNDTKKNIFDELFLLFYYGKFIRFYILGYDCELFNLMTLKLRRHRDKDT